MFIMNDKNPAKEVLEIMLCTLQSINSITGFGMKYEKSSNKLRKMKYDKIVNGRLYKSFYHEIDGFHNSKLTKISLKNEEFLMISKGMMFCKILHREKIFLIPLEGIVIDDI